MSEKVTNWLSEIGLGRYAPQFLEQEILFEDLPDLSDEDLKEIGVPLGPRKRILKAAASLRAENSRVAEAAAEAGEGTDGIAAWERHPGERKPVTMLFADITGSTALTERMDAEDTHELVYGAVQRMCTAVERNAGTVCRFMGDGVMAMFGAPVAREQHALEACQAAIDIQRAISDYVPATTTGDQPAIQVRVGLHSGEIVVLEVGEGDKVEYDASGPTVPIAARMEQCARPGQVLMTNATRSLAGPLVEAGALTPVTVKGITEPVPVFALNKVHPPEDPVSHQSRSVFVGRRAELNQFAGTLQTCLDEGGGQTIYVRGEPGIGKTRLVEEFVKLAGERGVAHHRGLVLPYGVAKSRDAIRSLVGALLGLAPGGDEAARKRAIERALGDNWIHTQQRVFMNDLLDLPQSPSERSLFNAMDNHMRNEGKREVVCQLVVRASETQPVLIIVEDVHWADDITLAHLAALSTTVPECRALLLLTSRLEGDRLDRNWRMRTDDSPLLTIDLGPLRSQESIALISEFIDDSEPVAQTCLERAAGNPLFLEQLLRAAREGFAASLPDSIQSLVLARLDRLEPEHKRALQAASVIGQRFQLDALCHLLDDPDCECSVLLEHHLVRIEGDGYLFAHALIQEGVYQSLLKDQRRSLHQKCAAWFGSRDSALKAAHLGRAGDPGASQAFLEAAEEHAGQDHLERALALTGQGLEVAADPGVKHGLRCLQGRLLHDLGEIDASVNVYEEALNEAHDDIQKCDAWLGMAAGMRMKTAYREGLALLEKAEPIATAHALDGHLSRLYHLRGNLCFPIGESEACHQGHKLALDHARKAGSPEDEARALGGLGDAEYARGRMLSARTALQACVDICQAHDLIRIEVANRAQIGNTMNFVASSRQARAYSTEVIETAIRIGNHRAEMNAYSGMSMPSWELNEPERLEDAAQRGLALARKLQSQSWEPIGLTYSAMANYLSGNQDKAERLLKDAAGDTVFTSGYTFGAMSMITRDSGVRDRAIAQGEAMLRKGAIGSGYLVFYRFAMEARLGEGNWAEARKYADRLQAFTQPEPLPTTDFFIARGRVLAAWGEGERSDDLLQEFRRLRDEAERLETLISIPALDRALSAFG